MAKRDRKKLSVDVLKALHERSKDKCECCGLDITIDKHHIWEFAKNGPDTTSNLLCLCPSCHRILPKLLSEEDQRFIQTLNFEKRSDSFSFYSNESKFVLGTDLASNVKYILVIDGKTIIYPYQINERFYVNVTMLDNFDPYLLVIANRLICKSDIITTISSPNGLKVMNRNKLFFSIEKSNDSINISISFRYRGLPFVFNDVGAIYPGPSGGIYKSHNNKIYNCLAAFVWTSPSSSEGFSFGIGAR